MITLVCFTTMSFNKNQADVLLYECANIKALIVPPSVCHKNFNLAHIFRSIDDRAVIFGMHDPCDKSFLLVPCGDLDLDLLPTSRSNLLPSGGPQFFEFA